MFKSKLQELCQHKHWSLPRYSTSKDGPNHAPRFTTTVTVNGLSFDTPIPSKSSKDSQNEAAKLAFDHLTILPKTPTEPSLTVEAAPEPSIAAQSIDDSSRSFPGSDMFASLMVVQPKIQDEPGLYMEEECPVPKTPPQEECPVPEAKPQECLAPTVNQSRPVVNNDVPVRDVWHLSKNQLQMYAQRRNLPLPTYSCERDGPPHAARFKCKVAVDGKTFDGPDFCCTLKDAEHAVARVALLTLSSNVDQESDSGLYKNLLQEFAQREGYHLPTYETQGSGGQFPAFTSTVVIEGGKFTGAQGRTKKQAEMNAAKVAYTTLKERKRSQTSTSQFPAHQSPRTFTSSLSSQLNANPLSISPRPDAVPDFTLLAKGENGSRENSERDTHDRPLPSCGANRLTSHDLLMADTIYAQLRNPTFEESSSGSSSSSENGLMVVATDTDPAMESLGEAVSLPPRGVIRVYARALNVTLPPGTTVAYSDDNWVAVVGGTDLN